MRRRTTMRARIVRSLRRRRRADRRATPRTAESAPTPPARAQSSAPSGVKPLIGFSRFNATGRTVVVLTDPEIQQDELLEWIDKFDSARVHVITSAPRKLSAPSTASVHRGGTVAEIGAQLRRIGPVDLIVDLLPSTVDNVRVRWQRLFFHLKPRGFYAIDAAQSGIEPFSAEVASWTSAVLAAEEPASASRANAQEELAHSVAALCVFRELIVIEKRLKHYLKLRDAEVEELLPTWEPGMDVQELARRAAGELVSKARVTSHESAVPIQHLDDSFHYPELYLRHYRGPLRHASTLLVHGEHTILPDSFRHHLERNPNNPRMVNASPEFARIPHKLRAAELLVGDFYLLDSAFPAHYGHLTTELISRLWGWDEAKKALPGVKALFQPRPGSAQPTIERRFLEAYGIAPDDIVEVAQPVRLESLVGVTPMWHNQVPHYVHPGMRDVWDRLAAGLTDPAAPTFSKIFVSRKGLKNRDCRNTPDVEAVFRARGFEIVYPEEYDLSAQAAIFGAARVVAGFGGSAMFNLLFSRHVETVILLSHEAYTARNEHLITALLGADVHYFWSPPDIPHPVGGWTFDAFYSGWEFDFARNGTPLNQLLADL